MAAAEKSKFPVIPAAHWWSLRKKFQQTIPGVVTANYIASVLNMQEDSARANVLPGLRTTKIIDEEGKPLERAKRWRDDEQYPAVCQEILQDCYPVDLRDAFPDPAKNKPGVSRWFGNHTGTGAAAVTKMVQFYTLLCEADPAKALSESKKTKGEKPIQRAVKLVQRSPNLAVPGATVRIPEEATRQEAGSGQVRSAQAASAGPAVHINLQVHISADASTDQIDQVFASMAKHIYKKAGE